MKKIYLNYLLFLSLVIGADIASAQPWRSTFDTATAVNFFDVQRAFENYWSGKTVTKGQGYNTFRRWEEFWVPRVGTSGVMPPTDINAAELYRYRETHRMDGFLRGAFDSGNWVSVGPNQTAGGYNGLGRVNCIAFHPTDSNIFYIGAPAGGIWVTKDFGKTWTALGDKLPSMGVSDIAIDPKDPNIIYVATGDRDFGSLGGIQGMSGSGDTKSMGIFKTRDGGKTWRQLSLSFAISAKELTNRIIISPADNRRIYAATSTGLFVSTDSGATWQARKTGYYIDMEINPSNPNILYAASYGSSAQILRSKDAGMTWTTVTNLSGAGRINVEVTKANGGLVMAVAANASDEGLKGIYKSTDSGATFTLIYDGGISGQNLLNSSEGATGTGGQGWYDLALAIHPRDQNLMFLGGVNTWRSTNGGTSWTLNSYWTNNSSGVPIVHADKHVQVFHPLSKVPNGTIFEGNDGGIYFSRNRGTSWTDLTNGLAIGQIYRIAVSNNGALVLAGHQDNGTQLKNASNVWTNASGGDGMDCEIDQTNSNYMYAGIQYGKIVRSSNAFSSGFGSTTISDNISGVPRGAWVTPYMLDPNNQSVIVAGYADVYRTTNRGNSWTKLSTNITGSSTNYLRSVAISPVSGNLIFVANYSNIWKTSNGGTTWFSVKNNLNISASSITNICLHPTDSATLWVTLSGYDAGKKVYKSIDGGKTWTNISGTLPNLPVNCITYEKGSAKNNIYIGTDIGVFVRNDAFSDWVFFSRNLPYVPVTDLEINYQGQRIFAGTHGRGLWQSNLWSAAPPAAPVAVFSCDDSAQCQGGIVTFKNKSINYSGISWQFPGGIPSTSTDTMPQVQYPNAGTYKVTLIATGAGGTDTLAIDKYVTMFANPPRPTISQDTNRLISSADTSIQWYLGSTPIAGANSKIYNAKSDGVYKVEYTDSNGCKSVSANYNFKYTRVGIGIIPGGGKIDVFPNPGEGKFYISNTGNDVIKNIQIIDMSGKLVRVLENDGKTDLTFFDISSEEKGLYMLRAILNDGSTIHLLISKL